MWTATWKSPTMNSYLGDLLRSPRYSRDPSSRKYAAAKSALVPLSANNLTLANCACTEYLKPCFRYNLGKNHCRPVSACHSCDNSSSPNTVRCILVTSLTHPAPSSDVILIFRFKKMNEKFYKIMHPLSPEEKELFAAAREAEEAAAKAAELEAEAARIKAAAAAQAEEPRPVSKAKPKLSAAAPSQPPADIAPAGDFDGDVSRMGEDMGLKHRLKMRLRQQRFKIHLNVLNNKADRG